MECKARISMPEFGKFFWGILQVQNEKQNPKLPALTCVAYQTCQITVLEVTKIKQKSSMTDGVHNNGPTVKNVKRCQPRIRVLSRN